MRCLIPNCLHSVRASGARSSSWNEFQICPCCAYEMYALNLNDRKFWKFRTPAFKRCMTHNANRKQGKPTTMYILEVLLVRPSTKEEILSILNEAFNLDVNIARISHGISELKRQGLILKNGPVVYPARDLIEVPI